ncbi:CapA family protein [Sulfidibacter corallicola]|uniref:CapA family protein n=1 Tax=Sulfidibacter corallicola TaxID=2818388 RepID=A0A8A4U584_SULCO|nr:CapA family protein [Sulfidibacter corallicola]QTD53905.1 CapA family protein [Sulfidibacter corallicola]
MRHLCSTCWVALWLLLSFACSGSYRGEDPVVRDDEPTGGDTRTFSVTVQVLGESGEALENAVLDGAFGELTTNASGQVRVPDLLGPESVVIRAPGHLAEPVVLGWSHADRTLAVNLLGDGGGTRWVMHATGDAMFGRRYQDPPNGEALIPGDNLRTGSEAVVAHMRRAFTAADFRTINLETTVSDLAPSFAYPGKRFILNSPTETLAAIQALETDLVILANNHTRDYGDLGVVETVEALHAAGIVFQGAGASAVEAEAPTIHQIAGTRIGSLAYTTVTGSFVNANYPDGDEPVPADLPDTERWQYESREWGFEGATWTVARSARRIGEVWRLFAAAERNLPAEEVATAWSSIDAVYPEMQDWVARRGHGGAAFWTTSAARAAIAELAERTDVVIVQLHSGFQYQETPSESLRRNARTAIDAGADLVVCHHPHVLQGVEWYKDKLIAYSLGNFVFDQDFLVTFSSAFLRTVWEGERMIQARLVPFEIQGYKPVPVTGSAARRTLLNIWEMNLNQAQSLRDTTGQVRSVAIDLEPDTVPAHLAMEHFTGRITRQPPEVIGTRIMVRPGETATLPPGRLYHGRLGLAPDSHPEIQVGRDIFGWGHFEDVTADAVAGGFTHWNLDRESKGVIEGDAHGGRRFLRIIGQSSESEGILTRPVARVPLPRNRLFQLQSDGSTLPSDPSATYSLRFHARLTGETVIWNRFDIYQFIDTDPTAEPESTLLRTHEVPASLTPETGWHTFDVSVDEEILTNEGVRGNALNFYMAMAPPASARATLDVDDLVFVAWRRADHMPDRFGHFRLVRNQGTETVELVVPSMSLAP